MSADHHHQKESNFCKSLGKLGDVSLQFLLQELSYCDAILLTDKLFHMKAVIHEGAD